MLTFIISVVLVSFICLCFFKKNFWENRYLVLLICGCVALIATLIVNFTVRGKLLTKTEVLWNKPMTTFYIPAELFKDSMLFVKNYNYYDSHKAKEFYRDTTKKQVPVRFFIYKPIGKYTDLYVGTMTQNYSQDYDKFDKVYFVKNTTDTLIYTENKKVHRTTTFISRKKLYYDATFNNWISGFSLPRKSTITIFHVPPKEFALIPDSLIRKVPF